MGPAIGSTSSGPWHTLQWASKFARELVKISLGGEAYALSEMVNHLMSLGDFAEPFVGLDLSMAGEEACEKSVYRPEDEKGGRRGVLGSAVAEYPTGPKGGRIGQRLLVSGNGEPRGRPG